MEKTMVLAKTAEKPNYESEILRIIRGNTSPKAMLNQLEDYHGSDIADVIEQLSEQERKKVFRICPAEMLAEAFAHLEEEKAGECLKEISPERRARSSPRWKRMMQWRSCTPSAGRNGN